jgi:DNA polymerase type B, organellar and viral
VPRRKNEVWAADCETDPFKAGRIPKPFIWGAYDIYSGQYETFGSAQLFVDFFRERRATVYFHNGGKFDGHYLRPYFDSDQELLIINGRIARFEIGDAEFRDSYNLIPVALGKYQKESIDYDLMEVFPVCNLHTREDTTVRDLYSDEIERYLKSDCVNLATLLRQYFERYGRGFTQAGAAMTYWAKHYNKGVKPKQSAAQFERYRPYYYGGRVECFASGYKEETFTVVDKNSAYPHAMLSRHPISPEAVHLSRLPDDSKIPQCFITLRAVSLGAFPYRLESGELIFPRDGRERIYDITGWEFQAAVSQNAVRIKEIIAVHYFRETVDFQGYIHHFYNERKIAKCNQDVAGDIFAKLFMNSCYGKFASNPENYHEYMLSSVERLDEHVKDGYQEYHPWGDGRRLLWRTLPIEKHRYYNIATAASITGYVRAQIFSDLCRVRDPLYCDTDSIAALSVDNLSVGPELGQWKVEKQGSAWAIVGKKMYAFRDAESGLWDKVACKGVKFTADQIIRAARGDVVEYEPMAPCYTITRPEPRFINRRVRLTATVQTTH